MRWIVVITLTLIGLISANVAVSAFSSQSTVTLLSEHFEGKFPPKGWQVIVLGNSGGAWKRNDDWMRQNFAGTGYCACADSDRFGYEMETELRTPMISLKDCKKVTLTFNMDFRNDDDMNVFMKGHAKLLISTDGKSWKILKEWVDDYNGKVTIDLTPYVGKDIMIAWHYYGDGVYWWEIDDVEIIAEK